MRKSIGKPGPGGSIIVPADYQPRGPARGSRGKPRTKKQLAALRTNGYRRNVDGLVKKYGLAVGRGDAGRAEETLKAIIEATEGRFDAFTRINVGKLARLSAIHDAALTDVERDGVTVSEDVTDSEGRIMATRKREHPALGSALKLGDVLGVSAKEQMLTPAARGAGRRDDAVADYFSRQDRVRAFLESAPAVDAEIVKENE